MSTRLAERLDREIATEPLLAWRAWGLSGRRDGSNLLLRPVTGRAKPWPPGRPAEASCRIGRFHSAPHPECTCGLHGTFELDILRRTRCPAVLGRVAMWGRVIEHEFGYRARFAYPQRVRLNCQFCFWMWGLHGSAPTIIGWFPRDELVPLCDEHLEIAQRYGMVPRSIVPAAEVEQRLRAAYAVDPLLV